MKRYLALTISLIASCASNPAQNNSANWIEPSQAVQLAAAKPEEGIRGTFVLTVRTAERTQSGHLFLDSEKDYRDQRNLAVDVMPSVIDQLQAQLGSLPEQALQGQRILVTGTAKRTKITFFANGHPTDRYYYQTHVAVTDASQIQTR